jgi:transcriptional regulator with XRE-family HTH domain
MSLADNIRVRRVQLDLTQKELAVRAGVSQQLVHALEAGTTRSTKFIREIALALGCDVSHIDPRYSKGNQFEEPLRAAEARYQDLPIYAAAETDRGIVVIPDQPIDFIPRPFPLMNVRGGYGVLVAADFMRPEFEPGDYALVNPHIPPIMDTTCVLYQETDKGTVGRIRRISLITPNEWHAKAWNPQSKDDELAILPRAIWHQCHRIVGRYFRR